MALVCISGTKECTACRLCLSASVCEICGKKIPDGKKYYELLHYNVCRDCTQFIIAEGEMVCSLCGDAIACGDEVMRFEYNDYCPVCARILEHKKNYV